MINFLKNGYEIKKSFFNSTQCSKLLKKVYQSRNFNKIWLSEHEYKNNKILKTVNPRPGRNLIEKLDTSFIFSNEKFITLLNQIMGNSWRVLDYKFVVALEKKMVPNWVSNFTKDAFIPNMGRFIKEKYRDITYFRGIDFHQDIIDFPHKQSDFATFYIYLDNVDKNSSPLILFPKSHIYGAKTFPHDIKKENNFYRYYNNSKTSIKIKPKSLIGKCGTMYFWHPCILHGTQPTFKDKFRISIRILIEKNHLKKKYLIDKLNSKIKGSLSVKNSRRDINKKTGKYIIKGNFINKNYK